MTDQEAIKKAKSELASAETMLLLCNQARSRPAIGARRMLLEQDVHMANFEVQQRERELDRLTKEASAS